MTTTLDNQLQAVTIGGMGKVMSLRLPDDVAQALEKYAEADQRSQAQVAVMALRYFLERNAGRTLAEMRKSGEVGSLAGVQIDEESEAVISLGLPAKYPATETSETGDRAIRESARMRKRMEGEKKSRAGVSGEAAGVKILGQPVVADASMEPGSFRIEPMPEDARDWSKNPVGKSAGHVATEAEAVAKWGSKESPSKFRTSPDGKPCKHMLYRCDRGCWK